MGYESTSTSEKGFAPGSVEIREKLIEEATEIITGKNFSLHGISNHSSIKMKAFGKNSSARMDIDCEGSNHEGDKEKVLKIQLQIGSGTYASVVIHSNAIEQSAKSKCKLGDPELYKEVAECIKNSCNKQIAYEISYVE
jgi:hypothetical protein